MGFRPNVYLCRYCACRYVLLCCFQMYKEIQASILNIAFSAHDKMFDQFELAMMTITRVVRLHVVLFVCVCYFVHTRPLFTGVKGAVYHWFAVAQELIVFQSPSPDQPLYDEFAFSHSGGRRKGCLSFIDHEHVTGFVYAHGFEFSFRFGAKACWDT